MSKYLRLAEIPTNEYGELGMTFRPIADIFDYICRCIKTKKNNHESTRKIK
jgi:hypothetical protein